MATSLLLQRSTAVVEAFQALDVASSAPGVPSDIAATRAQTS